VTEPQEPRSTASNHLTSEELSECAFSPETAAAGWLEHADGCTACSAELADLRLLLTRLAELPEPEVPESVVIRLDAAVARAWQEADAEDEAKAADPRRGTRQSWRKIAIPIGSLALIAAVAIGVGSVISSDDTSTSSSASSGSAAGTAAAGPFSNAPITQSALTQWVQSVLPTSGGGGVHSMTEGVRCAATPKRAGYTVLTTSEREYNGVPATLIVYQNAQEPSSNTVYAVVYKGSCATTPGEILAEGSVSR
jgi:hypothetical protein